MVLDYMYVDFSKYRELYPRCSNKLELVFTRAAPAFDNRFMGCVFNINTVHKTVEKLTFQAFY